MRRDGLRGNSGDALERIDFGRCSRLFFALNCHPHGSGAPVNSSRRSQPANCSLPLPPVLIIGSLLSAAFFGLIVMGPLDIAILRRYCLSHPVAIASVCLFFVGITGLALKWLAVQSQTRATSKAVAVLRRLVTDGEEITANQRPDWLHANWQSQTPQIQDSWFGRRIQRTLEMQISRGRRTQLESDLKSFSELDADRQHDSYALMRIINWAMPMLGFLGTVLGISQTLGQLDTKMLATQQQDAMNQLTAGLYVAFDTTAIALILTVCLMFVQFAISRLEQNILSQIDRESGDCLVRFLSADPHDAKDTLLSPVRELLEELIGSVRHLVIEQSGLWAQSLSEAQIQWSQWSSNIAEQLEASMGASLSNALEKHVADLGELQDEGNRQQDLRWQQWQTTLSDQARLIQSQQKEMVKQSDALQQLVVSTTDLRKLEETVQESVARLENVGRIEEATECVGEAVAVLATCLERAGVIRGTPIRPRVAEKEKRAFELQAHVDLADDKVAEKVDEPKTMEASDAPSVAFASAADALRGTDAAQPESHRRKAA